MTRRSFHLAVSLTCILAAGCSDDQSVDPGAASSGDAVIEVTFEGQSVPVDLGNVTTSTYKDVELVKLSDLWEASGIATDRTTLAFEFVASDGFKPSVKDCEDVPGDVLDRGYVDPATRNLTWDESLGYGGCYSVRETVQMNARATQDEGTGNSGR